MTLRILSKNKVKLKKKLRRIYNKYIVLREANMDGYVECYTCGVHKQHTEMECGHYWHNKSLPLAFEERNTHPQCKKCNTFLSGNLAEYIIELKQQYHADIGEELKALDKPIPQGHFWIADKIDEYTAKLKDLE